MFFEISEKRDESKVGTSYSESRIPSLKFFREVQKNVINPTSGQHRFHPQIPCLENDALAITYQYPLSEVGIPRKNQY